MRGLSYKYFTGQPISYLSLTTILALRHIRQKRSQGGRTCVANLLALRNVADCVEGMSPCQRE